MTVKGEEKRRGEEGVDDCAKKSKKKLVLHTRTQPIGIFALHLDPGGYRHHQKKKTNRIMVHEVHITCGRDPHFASAHIRNDVKKLVKNR